MKNNSYYVYIHKNKTNNKVYIGITMKKKPEDRWGKNGNGYKPYYGRTNYFWNAIQKYGWDNFEHIILFSGLSKKEAEQKEIDLIKEYDSTNPKNGYNIQHGGKHIDCHNESTKKHISEIQKKAVYQYDRFSGCFIQMFESTLDAENALGIPNSDISSVCLGKFKTIHNFVFRYAKNAEYGESLSQKELDIINSNDWYRGVIEYDKNGDFVCEYRKVSDVPNISKSTLNKCLKGIKNHYKGRIFRYASEIDELSKFHINIDFVIDEFCNKNERKKVYMYNLDNVCLHVFNSASECAIFLNVTTGAITYCVQHSGIIKNQYKIKYA